VQDQGCNVQQEYQQNEAVQEEVQERSQEEEAVPEDLLRARLPGLNTLNGHLWRHSLEEGCASFLCVIETESSMATVCPKVTLQARDAREVEMQVARFLSALLRLRGTYRD